MSYEIAEFTQRPEFLVAVHLGIMSRNGEFEPGEKQALVAGLQELGLMDENGSIVLDENAISSSIDAKTVETDITSGEARAPEPARAAISSAHWSAPCCWCSPALAPPLPIAIV